MRRRCRWRARSPNGVSTASHRPTSVRLVSPSTPPLKSSRFNGLSSANVGATRVSSFERPCLDVSTASHRPTSVRRLGRQGRRASRRCFNGLSSANVGATPVLYERASSVEFQRPLIGQRRCDQQFSDAVWAPVGGFNGLSSANVGATLMCLVLWALCASFNGLSSANVGATIRNRAGWLVRACFNGLSSANVGATAPCISYCRSMTCIPLLPTPPAKRRFRSAENRSSGRSNRRKAFHEGHLGDCLPPPS